MKFLVQWLFLCVVLPVKACAPFLFDLYVLIWLFALLFADHSGAQLVLPLVLVSEDYCAAALEVRNRGEK